jgi:hypothetical protein
MDSLPQPTKSEKIFSYIKVGLSTTTGLVQQPVQIVVRYRSHNLTLFVSEVTTQKAEGVLKKLTKPC